MLREIIKGIVIVIGHSKFNWLDTFCNFSNERRSWWISIRICWWV